MRQGLAAYRTTRAELAWPHWLALLADVYGQRGQTQEGIATVAEALAQVEKTGERWYEAELYRLKGELLCQQGAGQESTSEIRRAPSALRLPPVEVEECFHKAISVARRQHARMWELRATVSLARLWQQQGKKDEARHMLAEIYSWFTEGFDTKDLQEAKALLAELGER